MTMLRSGRSFIVSLLDRRERQLTALVAYSRGRPPRFSAGRPADRATWRDQHLVDIDAADGEDATANCLGEIGRSDRAIRLCHDDDAVGSALESRHTQRDDPATPDAAQIINRPLKILWMVLPAVNDDYVLDPATDKQLTFVQISQVTGSEPSPADRVAGQRLIFVVAAHDRWSDQRDLADVSRGELSSLVIDDGQPMARQRPAATDDFHCWRFPLACRACCFGGRNRDSATGKVVGQH